jgi:hypothetical protein
VALSSAARRSLANGYRHVGDCPHHVRASRLWKKSHTFGLLLIKQGWLFAVLILALVLALAGYL